LPYPDPAAAVGKLPDELDGLLDGLTFRVPLGLRSSM
jgi:hypothetical protein